MVMKKGAMQLVEEAEAEISTLSPAEAHAMMDDPDVQLVDIRDVRELDRKGMIPGALHAPRGMLEFWVDPESPYHKPAFATGQTFVLYCAGGLRSALAAKTLQDMGLAPVAHIGGGFAAWQEAQLPTAPRPSSSPSSHPSSKKTG
ncbi:Rhodanese-related sulfurtransferase [Caenispirillum salinarum AK4]|uniref:Rhodanese-related sulfurtransferase n=1 Tax=Caenispirillum salinarum AK4 TaxID=1238182 RepID=K9HN21_9PROT|nr:rhodanese-like domain-containing protein [Caenispirillum salinarum]EKV31703.1 Rhodanese-related sulfurtransferase [Caenispirillum salinarum AK4]